MLEQLSALFSYAFIQRALIVGPLAALCSALLGVSLVLKRYSMIGDGLSHVSFGALAIAVALGLAPLQISLPVVVAAAFLLLRLSRNAKIKGDAAIAMISSSALAIGVIVISFTTGMNTDVNDYMFGSILTVSRSDVILSVVSSVIVIALYALFYTRLFAVTFDETFAAASGVRTGAYNTLLALLTAVTIVVGMRIMGAMLISSLIIFPPLTSMRICRSFRGVVLCSAAISVLCFFVGILLSFAFSLPAGATVVLINLAAFLLFSLIGKLRR